MTIASRKEEEVRTEEHVCDMIAPFGISEPKVGRAPSTPERKHGRRGFGSGSLQRRAHLTAQALNETNLAELEVQSQTRKALTSIDIHSRSMRERPI